MLTVVTGIWFTWGGVRDIKTLFRRLRMEKTNPLDNGIVVDGRNLDESKESEAQSSTTNRL